MVRQCAWCLCLINSEGERVSSSPLPKLYEATHGICGLCGIQWMEQVMEADEAQAAKNDGRLSTEVSQQGQQERHETITQLVLQLQQNPTDIPPAPWLKRSKRTRSL